MSGGRRIDDHKFFAGGMSKDSVLPKGVHTQHHETDGRHDGHEPYYEDTDSAITSAQRKNASTARGHKQRDGYRY